MPRGPRQVYILPLLGVVTAFINVFDGDQAPVSSLPRPSLVTATDVADILVGLPHVFPADLTFRPALDEHARSRESGRPSSCLST
jgi:hypothetical protein